MKEIVVTKQAPAAIGPYSQAIKAGGFVFASGQIPLIPESGEVDGADVKTQARRSLENLTAVLKAAGASLEDVVKTTVFITDMAEFPAVNEVYATYFPANAPARSCVAVAALPRGVKVEVEAIAQLKS
ncbi:MAG: RidA family protein [Desulfovibrio aminophilus]|jgi:2-iminobutanoate/2-iminopropanoate deaminase|uniref:RidA family protein n=1 Tax=Desulfovibrio aminophilus TaxID=81425 RepID=UPI000400F7FA|nr:RidA family protein [Desulfovibrio aminophilus]MDY0307917.1 RidA family protein [Desulfovibrionaceae bacterium]